MTPSRGCPPDEKGPGKTIFVPLSSRAKKSRPLWSRPGLDSLAPAWSKSSRLRAERVEPGCPYFGRCGGCQYQHIDYPAQLRYKSEILRETLRRTAKLELQCEIQIHAAEPWHYRNRTRMRIQTAPAFQLGYHRTASHQILAVETVPHQFAADQ